MLLRSVLTDQSIEAADLLRDFIGQCDGAGAVVSFCGLARGRGADGGSVSTLRLERHPRLTQLSLDRIVQEASGRFDHRGLLVVHRWGAIGPGETIVFVAAAARHRRAAFLAADYLMDRLKTEAVFWKKEEGIDGSRWIEPTADDMAAVARWEH